VIKTGNKTTAVMRRAIDGGMLDRNDPGFVGGLLFFNGFLFRVPHLGGSVFYPNVAVAGLFLALTAAACLIYGGSRSSSKEPSLR